MSLPVPLRVHVLNFFDDTKQEEVRTLPLVSKQFYLDCKQPGFECNIVSTFTLRPVSDKDYGSTRTFFQNMGQHQRDPGTNSKLQRYSKMILQHPEKFREFLEPCEITKITDKVRMGGILSLQISLASKRQLVYLQVHSFKIGDSLLRAISFILPNLREIDFFNTNFNPNTVLSKFSTNCPRLEKVKWNTNHFFCIHPSGIGMRSLQNLKEINMDDCRFYFYYGDNEYEEMNDLNNHPDSFLFHNCCNVLERVSIRKAKTDLGKIFPQNMLIKFVQNAPPTLKWFRSDLTKDNMDALKRERPNIELLN